MVDAVASTTRQERKQQTRDALLAAALGLTEFHSFDHLSLRQVTKEVGIVPGGVTQPPTIDTGTRIAAMASTA